MFRKSRADSVRELFGPLLGENEVAFMYMGYSGILMRMGTRTVAFDTANLLRGREVSALQGLDLLIFTHGHGDHFRRGEALEIFKATKTHILAEPGVARELGGKIPVDKLTSAEPGKTYTIGDIGVTTIRGIHRGPINLYLVKLGELAIFHGGDSGYVPLKDYRADLAFLPTGSPSPTASPEHASMMASDLKPRVVVAIHGSAAQNEELRRRIKGEMPGTSVVIPELYTPKRITL
ncbi:MAG: MBL fold metallo-hydrolase [Candidatus Bathyarchaeia archaeon]